jgi:tetratricopeptide (TPR) repeat protein
MKTTSKIMFIAFLFILMSHKLNAQDTTGTALRTAFETSYIYEDAGQYAKGITNLKNMYDANSYDINLRLGWLCYKNAAYTESVKYYKIAVTLKPKSIEARLGYVLPLAALNSNDSVKAQYEKILSLDPMNSKANYWMGYIYFYKANYTTAQTYLEKVSVLYPFDYDITLLLAWTYLKLEKKTEAKDLFKRVLRIDPDDTSAPEGLKLLK